MDILNTILGNDKAKVGLTSLLAVAAVGLAAFTAVKAIDESKKRNALTSETPVGEQNYTEEENEGGGMFNYDDSFYDGSFGD